MDTSEHIYHDDPKNGHKDVKTTLKDVDYYFLGNGHLEAAIQICTSGKATPVGVIIMNPEEFGPKRAALSMEPESGLEKTLVTLHTENDTITADAKHLQAFWTDVESVPCVEVSWENLGYGITERFYCSDRETNCMVREITINKTPDGTKSVYFSTGAKDAFIVIQLDLDQNDKINLIYTIENDKIVISTNENFACVDKSAKEYWQHTISVNSSHPKLDRLLVSSKNQLPSNISVQGMMDASIWQYNLEWVRDQSNVIMGLTVSGQFELARTMLDRIFTKFVTKEGDTVDSGRVRERREAELDQNGVLLLALKNYVDWTGDITLIEKHWQKIIAVAEFPIQEFFAHSCGLLHNVRDIWERHDAYGILDGFESSYQVYVSVGLACAADFAKLVNKTEFAEKWSVKAEQLKQAILNGPYAMIDNRHFIKRRTLDGQVQYEANPLPGTDIPPGVPLDTDQPHFLNPDSTSVLPMVLGFVDVNSEVAQNTLQEMEKLWNMTWDFGGYARYNVSSEPDSPGPWPLASAVIAQAHLLAGNDGKVWQVVDFLNTVPGSGSGAWFEVYGDRPVPPCPQIGILPWAWAEVIKFFVQYFLGISPSQDGYVKIEPRLLSGLDTVNATVRVHKVKLDLTIVKVAPESRGMVFNEKFTPGDDGCFVFKIPESDSKIELRV